MVYKNPYLYQITSSLRGSASYETVDGYKSLYLNGAVGTYAEVPAFNLTAEMTFAFWVRVPNQPTKAVVLADWSSPYKFLLRFVNNGLEILIRNSGGIDMFSLGWPISKDR